MKTALDVVIPTFNRVFKVKRFLESLRTEGSISAGKMPIRVWVVVDNNDIVSHRQIDQFIKTSGLPVRLELLPKQLRAFGVWNRHLRRHPTTHMAYICDDTELQAGCLRQVFHIIESKFPDGDCVIGLNQENISKGEGFSRSAMGVIGKKFADRFPNRQCFCPDYISFHADAELGRYARSVGKFYYAEEAKLHHHHPKHERKEVDDTHWVVRSVSAEDRRVYTARRERSLTWGGSFDLVGKQQVTK